MKPRISVLTVVYNGEMFLKETIDSVLDQTFEDFEYIIIDDGSVDRTKEIIESYKDKRIKYFYVGENKGFFNYNKAVNFGLKMCKGDYIARLDTDDIMYKNRLEVQYNYLEKNKDIFLLGTSCDFIDVKGNKTGNIIKKELPSFILKCRIAFSNPFIHSSIMFRNEGFKYKTYREDIFYYDLFTKGKKLVNIKDILVQYRINPSGMISSKIGEKENE